MVDLKYKPVLICYMKKNLFKVNDTYKSIDNCGKMSINVLHGALSAASTCTLSKIGKETQ